MDLGVGMFAFVPGFHADELYLSEDRLRAQSFVCYDLDMLRLVYECYPPQVRVLVGRL